MNESRALVASYATCREAVNAAEALSLRGHRADAKKAPDENGEWPVYARGPIPLAAVERCRRFLRARHAGEPVSW